MCMMLTAGGTPRKLLVLPRAWALAAARPCKLPELGTDRMAVRLMPLLLYVLCAHHHWVL